jgi:hypothetical protein
MEARTEILDGNGNVIPRVLPGYRVITNFPNYEINHQGVVRRRNTHRKLKSNNGRVNLRKDGESYNLSIESLVEHHFVSGQ